MLGSPTGGSKAPSPAAYWSALRPAAHRTCQRPAARLRKGRAPNSHAARGRPHGASVWSGHLSCARSPALCSGTSVGGLCCFVPSRRNSSTVWSSDNFGQVFRKNRSTQNTMHAQGQAGAHWHGRGNAVRYLPQDEMSFRKMNNALPFLRGKDPQRESAFSVVCPPARVELPVFAVRAFQLAKPALRAAGPTRWGSNCYLPLAWKVELNGHADHFLLGRRLKLLQPPTLLRTSLVPPPAQFLPGFGPFPEISSQLRDLSSLSNQKVASGFLEIAWSAPR